MSKPSEVPKSESPATNPKSKKGSRQSNTPTNQSFYQQGLFFSLAMDMTWQLALVVIVPIVGGFLLDKHFHTTPWITLTGFILAAIGVFGVLSRIVAQANRRGQYHGNEGKP